MTDRAHPDLLAISSDEVALVLGVIRAANDGDARAVRWCAARADVLARVLEVAAAERERAAATRRGRRRG